MIAATSTVARNSHQTTCQTTPSMASNPYETAPELLSIELSARSACLRTGAAPARLAYGCLWDCLRSSSHFNPIARSLEARTITCATARRYRPTDSGNVVTASDVYMRPILGLLQTAAAQNQLRFWSMARIKAPTGA